MNAEYPSGPACCCTRCPARGEAFERIPAGVSIGGVLLGSALNLMRQFKENCPIFQLYAAKLSLDYMEGAQTPSRMPDVRFSRS